MSRYRRNQNTLGKQSKTSKKQEQMLLSRHNRSQERKEGTVAGIVRLIERFLDRRSY